MIKQAILTGLDDQARATITWTRTKNGSHIIVCQVYNSYINGMMPVRNIKTASMQNAIWEFEHCLDRLQDSGYKLTANY